MRKCGRGYSTWSAVGVIGVIGVIGVDGVDGLKGINGDIGLNGGGFLIPRIVWLQDIYACSFIVLIGHLHDDGVVCFLAHHPFSH